MYKRLIFKDIFDRLQEPRRFIQVLTGPRQVGKTMLARQVIEALKQPSHYASADDPGLNNILWLNQQWEIARQLAHTHKTAILILDEVQKIKEWSETVKKLWDEDTFNKLPLKVILLGSSPLLTQAGLTESLAGRFEKIPVTHWSYLEIQQAFGWNLDQYIYFGGYPGSAELISNEERWRSYINDSLIETTISRDILLMTRVDKPALLRQLFHLACHYSSQILSYQKMQGQLQEAGNTTTLSHYLQLLSMAGMVAGISKFSGRQVTQRASSPKLQVFNTALISAQSQVDFSGAKKDTSYWGRLTESAVGAYLMNSSFSQKFNLYYWREKNHEVDFILKKGNHLIALEVKSGQVRKAASGLGVFAKQFPEVKKTWIIGKGGIDLEQFFSNSVDELF